jgi:hypothetical protein
MKEFFKLHFAPHLLVVIMFGIIGYLVTLALDIRHLKEDVEVLSEAEGVIERIEKLESKNLGQVAYAQLSSAKTQRSKTHEPVKIQFELRDAISGVDFDPRINNTSIGIIHEGAYFLMAAPQVGRLHADSTKPACANFFMSINEKPLENSNVTLCLPKEDNTTKDVIVTQGIIPLHKGDKVSVMMSTIDYEDGMGAEALNPEDEPTVPSIIFSIFRLGNTD